ncbi:hypothetical protein BDZ89DRAFT_1081544 [Hymenopellis radicata]|nr:hypothetical protein BDZ89DRAFT_1081544 [Hymenopellis radicata]
MPVHWQDSCTADCSHWTADVADDGGHDARIEDEESYWKSCCSYISDEDAEEDCSDEDDEATGSNENIEIVQLIDSGDRSYWAWDWKPIESSDVKDLLGTSLDNLKGWVSETEYWHWLGALLDVQERSLDALAVLAEIVGGVARELWRWFQVSLRPTHGSGGSAPATSYERLQALLIVIKCSTRAWTDADWWGLHNLYIPGQRMYYLSFTSSLFDERILLDLSPGRAWKDLADVMQISLPYFREMTARVEALSKLHRVGGSSGSSDSTSTFGPTTITNLITCLDVAESVAKLVPVLGDVLEGTCGILRKIVQAAEGARAARDECKALAEHTACITLAIVTEIGSRSTRSGTEIKIYLIIGEVNQKIQKMSKLWGPKCFVSRGKIKAQVQELRAQVDNARISFQIGNDITTTRLLYDLSTMQARLMSRVDDIYKVQTRMDGKLDTTHRKLDTTDRKLDMILVKMHGAGYGDGQAFVEVENAD